LAERYLPAEVLRRPKQGFSSALPYLMGSQFRALFDGFFRDARLVGAGICRPAVIQQMLKAHLAGRTDHGNRLWLLLNAEIWYRIHIEGQRLAELTDETAELLGAAPVSGTGSPLAVSLPSGIS